MTQPKTQSRRCAVYTRKSSEEGLEQEFNSLHAQREACEAFIKSQAGEGWKLISAAYDDGGLSGGTMERPALLRLMEDIRSDKIDTVVVYKVDRLTRSLADFAKLVELFDAHKVSFVAVTQQFNTTSSMGRLTLNILLSFAQFEREVTGERIRDKIAASKKKGMWMGGNVPLGYDVKDRKLQPNLEEAQRVKHIYRRYLDLRCVRKLMAELDSAGITSKLRISADGRQSGGCPFSRGALYVLLSNPIYIGEIKHKDLRHPGQHEPILEKELWDAVQTQLKAGAVDRTTTSRSAPSPLTGKLYDENGVRLTPTHANKKGRRYRYYVSQTLLTGTSQANEDGWRVPAQVLEEAVRSGLEQFLEDRQAMMTALRDAGATPDQLPKALQTAQRLRQNASNDPNGLMEVVASLQRVDLGDAGLMLSLPARLFLASSSPDQTLTYHVALSIKRRHQEMRMIVARTGSALIDTDQALLKAIARAKAWMRELSSGQTSLADISQRDRVSKAYVSQRLPLAYLAPSIIEALFLGKQPAGLTIDGLMKHTDIPYRWSDQQRTFGFA